MMMNSISVSLSLLLSLLLACLLVRSLCTVLV